MTRYKNVGPPRRSSRLAALRSSAASSPNRANAADTSLAVPIAKSDVEVGITGSASRALDITSQDGDADASMDVPAASSDNQVVVTASPLGTGVTQGSDRDATDSLGTSGQAMATGPDPAPIMDIMALSTFTCFPKLPTELRHEIWTVVSHIPRNVDVRAKQLGELSCKDGNDILDYGLMEYFSKTPPPAILQTNAESRMVGLCYYKRTFSFDNGNNVAGWMFETEPKIYANLDTDWICPLGIFEFDGRWNLINYQCVNNLSLNVSSHHDQEFFLEIDRSSLKENPIKNIILHDSPSHCTHAGPIEFIELDPHSAKDDEGEHTWLNYKCGELLRTIDVMEEIVKNQIRQAEEEEKAYTVVGRAEKISDWKRWRRPAVHLKRMLIGGVDCSITDVKDQ